MKLTKVITILVFLILMTTFVLFKSGYWNKIENDEVLIESTDSNSSEMAVRLDTFRVYDSDAYVTAPAYFASTKSIGAFIRAKDIYAIIGKDSLPNDFKAPWIGISLDELEEWEKVQNELTQIDEVLLDTLHVSGTDYFAVTEKFLGGSKSRIVFDANDIFNVLHIDSLPEEGFEGSWIEMDSTIVNEWRRQERIKNKIKEKFGADHPSLESILEKEINK